MNAEILSEQQKLAAAGFYKGELDGIDGPLTRAARTSAKFFEDLGTHSLDVDARSAANIATLLPPVQVLAVQLLRKLAAAGISAKIISGTRTYEEQDALYEKGRTLPGPRVTNARSGFSNHNFGLAFDIGIFDAKGRYLEDSPLYHAAGQIGKSIGLDWGGDWKSIQDEPHFEKRPAWAKDLAESVMLIELRRRKSSGLDLFA